MERNFQLATHGETAWVATRLYGCATREKFFRLIGKLSRNVTNDPSSRGCVLPVSGSKEKTRKFLSTSSFRPEAVYFKGDRRSAKLVWPSSGFNLLLSGSEGLQEQASDTAQFIKLSRRDFDRMKAFGFKAATIDFGLYDVSTENHPWQTYRLPRSLIVLAAAYDFEVELSTYWKP